MRLISLELHGFKSFPDRTVLKFAPGVTTVVGPNGSGKSNISDAVRWVLGEISTKNMRAPKMEDIVFGGTDTRKPMQFAEVSLTLDNREEAGFSRLQSDYDEVTVTRRYNKNGTSEYKINGETVRLKDIVNLFMNTGIGRDGYSIVSQGKVAEIISQKSDERRNVFEEAAGISRYRHQKDEAARKLEATILNCERLADILNEKKTQLDRLEKDAEKAKKYIDIYEKKKEADVSLSIYDITGTRTKLDEKKEKSDILSKALNNADNEINDANAEYENLDLSKNRAKEKASALTTQIEEISDNRHSEDTNAKVMENESQHIKERIATTKENIEKYKEDLSEAENAFKKAQDDLNSVKNDFDGKNVCKTDTENSIYRLKTDIDNISIEIENILESSDKLNESSEELRMELASIEGTSKSTVSRRKELLSELEETELSTSSCKEGMEKYSLRMKDYEEKGNALRLKAENIEKNNSELQKAASELNSKSLAFSSDIRDIRTRIDSLRRMEELFEGYPHSVSAIMNAAKSGKLSGIIGPLSHIFSVKPQYALAIETALGSNIQNIVCETDESAKSAVAWLKYNNAGRTTFYPLNTMQFSNLTVNVNDLKKRPGFIGIASELVEYEPKFERVISNLLGRTLVFDNLGNANATSKAFGYRLRIVTKDGQIVNAGGSITGGAAKRESGVLNRTAAIEKLTADRLKIEAEKKTSDDKYNDILKEIDDNNKQLSEYSGKLKLINTLYQADLTHYTSFETQLNTVNDTLTKLRNQISDIDSYKEDMENKKAEIKTSIENNAKEIQRLSELKNNRLEVRSGLKANLETQNSTLTSIMLDLTALGKDVESAEKELENRENARNSFALRLSDAENSVIKDTDKLEEIRSIIIKSSEKAKTLLDDITKMTSERDEAENLANELEIRLSNLKKDITEKMSARELISNDYTKLASQIDTLSSDLDRSIDYLSGEYEITFSEAQALNYPPVTEENRTEISKVLTELKYKLRGIGSVDPASIEEYKEAKFTYEAMKAQFDDLEKSRNEYEHTVEILEKQMRVRFVDVMGEISVSFQKVFRELFGGGTAELVLTDPDDVLHCGIDINVALPGKNIKNLSLLSGGEKAFISIALFFAILNVNPSPFCVFDEIEAALDDVNVGMFANYMKKYSDKTQFITITHRRGTMEVADTLYGVTMAERGISRVLSLNVNEVESKLGVKL